ncbi:hypothetical protein [Marihabitans asiaticum]|uniref:Uncharacterized protein n=1 Tax=Marihabitans asiaticum TaxID=415218 RepID=A0A560W9W8_9MICO|nr:hypothetical protein [Marihabitans asiaticum]TWD14402.1 hypothetical protein FB557_1811 [Marihabitans asiaticum]
MRIGTAPALRLLRSLVLVLTSIGAGLIAHDHAGGASPSGATLTGVAVLLLIPVLRLSRQAVSPAAAMAVLVLGQLGVHLSALTGGHHLDAAGGAHAHSMPAPLAVSPHDLGLSPQMLLGHVAVAAALAALWSRGEQILFALLERLGPPEIPVWTVASTPPATWHVQVAATLEPARLAQARAPPA